MLRPLFDVDVRGDLVKWETRKDSNTQIYRSAICTAVSRSRKCGSRWLSRRDWLLSPSLLSILQLSKMVPRVPAFHITLGWLQTPADHPEVRKPSYIAIESWAEQSPASMHSVRMWFGISLNGNKSRNSTRNHGGVLKTSKRRRNVTGETKAKRQTLYRLWSTIN